MVKVRDYFSDLELTPNASLQEVRKAYKRLAKLYHPDHSGDAQKFTIVQTAYDNLNSEELIEKAKEALSMAKTNIKSKLGNYSTASQIKRLEESGTGRIENLDIRIIVPLDRSKLAGSVHSIKLSVENVCQTCRGLGESAQSKRTRCKKCSGLGYQMIRRGESFRWKKTCEACHGEGVELTEACKACGGYGKVLELEEIKISTPSLVDSRSPILYQGLGHHSFDGKTRGNLWVTWKS